MSLFFFFCQDANWIGACQLNFCRTLATIGPSNNKGRRHAGKRKDTLRALTAQRQHTAKHADSGKKTPPRCGSDKPTSRQKRPHQKRRVERQQCATRARGPPTPGPKKGEGPRRCARERSHGRDRSDDDAPARPRASGAQSSGPGLGRGRVQSRKRLPPAATASEKEGSGRSFSASISRDGESSERVRWERAAPSPLFRR